MHVFISALFQHFASLKEKHKGTQKTIDQGKKVPHREKCCLCDQQIIFLFIKKTSLLHLSYQLHY